MIKLFTKKIQSLSFAILMLGMQNSFKAQCTANFTFTYNANGNVSFTSILSPSVGAGKQWSFGNSQTSSATNPSITYTANGVYTVCLSMWTPSVAPTCSATTCQTINVTNAVTPTCVLNASFTQTVSAPNATFASNSTGTVVGSTYTWYYGDSNNGSGQNTTHAYSPGFYTCKLVVNNGSGCIDSAQSFVNIPAPCTLSANFAYTQNANGNVTFTSTSTGTVAGTTYTWKKNNVTFATGNPSSSNFTNGTYTITLVANNNFTPSVCSSSISQVITVTSNTCAMNASFTYTQGTSGQFTFANTSTGTNASTTYLWNFGDSFGTTGAGPHQHTYSNAGIHYASLFIQDANNMSCYDSVVVPVNVTSVPCVANSNFSMTMISTGYWNATPAYPWNVVSATWNWGDNTSSNQLYTNHTYSPTGVYNVCLTVSVSCGAQSSTCVTYTITKTSQAMTMAYINVIPPPQTITTGLKQMMLTDDNLMVYPNPSNGEFNIHLVGFNEKEANIKVYNLTGALIYEAKGTIANGNLDHEIKLDKAQGVYFVKIESTAGVITKKIILKD